MKNYLLPTALFGSIAIVSNILPAVALSPVEVQRIAQQTTIQITGCAQGSGVIIQKTGNTYTVLTAAHAVKNNGCKMTAPDDNGYQISQVKAFPNNVDLAVFKFTSNKTYPVAKLIDNSDRIEAGEPIYVSGFPLSTGITTSVFTFVKGDVVSNSTKQQGKGYSLIYSNSTLPGHSGGPVWNERGELVAIHGQGDIDTKLQTTANAEVRIKTGFNLGITINTFTKLATSVGIGGYTPVAVATKPKPLDDLIASATIKETNGDYRGMLTDMNQAIAIDSQKSGLYYVRGVAKFQLGDRQGAIEDYGRAIALNPSHDRAYSNRGLAKAELGNDQAAIADCNKAIAINPNLAEAYVNRSVAKFNLGDYQGIIADSNKAIALKPDLAQSYSNRGLAKSELGDNQAAIEDCNKAISLNPKLVQAYVNRSLAKFKLGDMQGTLEDSNKAIALDPKFAQSYANRAAAKLNLGDNQGTIADCNKAIALNPKIAQSYLNRGFAKFKLGDNQGAIADYNLTIAISPTFAQVYANLGVAKLQLGDRPGATAGLKKAAALFKQQGKTADYNRITEAIKQLGL
jgi:tetratricopeptide (TPR) repeat protein